MSNHHKETPGHAPTGAVDKNRRRRHNKMDRETKNPDRRELPDRDLRGIGRQMIEQQEREPDFDAIDRDRSSGRGDAA